MSARRRTRKNPPNPPKSEPDWQTWLLWLGLGGLGLWLLSRSRGVGGQSGKQDEADATISSPKAVRLATLPPSAELVFHADGFIYVMDRNGQSVSQITFEHPRRWEHVAVSHDRRHMVANAQPNSSLWLFDLVNGNETRLLPGFAMAGEGGVAWDAKGFIYFSAKPDAAGLPDVYKIRYDGTGLTQLTNTPAEMELDVSVSEDGTLITYVKTRIGDSHTEIWVGNSDGTNQRLVYLAGLAGMASAHDPEISPDNTKVAFSIINSGVAPNYPKEPTANTAHDIQVINMDGTGLTRLTKPGPISIIPNWQDDLIAYVEISERDNYSGASIVTASGREQTPKRIKAGANSPRWIPG